MEPWNAFTDFRPCVPEPEIVAKLPKEWQLTNTADASMDLEQAVAPASDTTEGEAKAEAIITQINVTISTYFFTSLDTSPNQLKYPKTPRPLSVDGKLPVSTVQKRHIEQFSSQGSPKYPSSSQGATNRVQLADIFNNLDVRCL